MISWHCFIAQAREVSWLHTPQFSLPDHSCCDCGCDCDSHCDSDCCCGSGSGSGFRCCCDSGCDFHCGSDSHCDCVSASVSANASVSAHRLWCCRA